MRSSWLLLPVLLVGCAPVANPTYRTPPTSARFAEAPAPKADADPVVAERAKLSPEDRAAVDAQEWCVISSDEQLGSMGPPIKLDVKGQAVFVCCKGCSKKALADPDATLAKAAELKAKKKAGGA